VLKRGELVPSTSEQTQSGAKLSIHLSVNGDAWHGSLWVDMARLATVRRGCQGVIRDGRAPNLDVALPSVATRHVGA